MREDQVGTAGERSRADGERAEREGAAGPRIYVMSVAEQPDDRRYGQWVDANQEPEELRNAIDAVTAEWPEEMGREWVIQGSEGFGDFKIGEHEPLEIVSAVGRGITECGSAFAAYVLWAGTNEEALRSFDRCFVGYWPSLEAYAREAVEEFGWQAELCKLLIEMQPYVTFDYERLGRSLAQALRVVPGAGGLYLFTDR